VAIRSILLVYRALPRTERSLVSGDRPDRFRAPLGGSRRSLTRRVMAAMRPYGAFGAGQLNVRSAPV
jgi:hypothetical protein